jgi:hypothetical protein
MMAATITASHGRARARSRVGVRESVVTCMVSLSRVGHHEG